MKYVSHSPASSQAAVAIEDRAGTLRRKVRDYLLNCGADGATDQEIQAALQMDPNTQRPRRIELVEARKVLDSGKQRKTLSGRAATVWIASEFVFRPAKQGDLFS